jgi:phage terminase small subunit
LCYNPNMALSSKYLRFIDEYLKDLNASAAAVRCGYAEPNARMTAYKILQKPEIKEELEKRFAETRISSSELIKRLDLMAMGEIPTKVITGSYERQEYDTKAAADSLARVYALFQDKIELDISHLNITDDKDP